MKHIQVAAVSLLALGLVAPTSCSSAAPEPTYSTTTVTEGDAAVSNGSGGSGTVQDGSTCQDGACEATTCSPNCAGKHCGDPDGCGATCGCPSSQACDPTSGACKACPLNCGNGTCAFTYDSSPTGAAVCHCDPGFYFRFDSCQPIAGSPCDGKTCAEGTCGTTGASASYPVCICDGDRIAYGNACIPWSRVRCKDSGGALIDKGTIRCSADDSTFEVCRDQDGDGNVEWAPSGAPSCANGPKCSDCLHEACDNGDGHGGTLHCPTGTICLGTDHQVGVYVCAAACDCSNCGTCDPSQFTGFSRACGSNGNNPVTVCKSPCAHASDGCLPYGANSFCFANEGCVSAPPM
jgi:hypothetical protein